MYKAKKNFVLLCLIMYTLIYCSGCGNKETISADGANPESNSSNIEINNKHESEAEHKDENEEQIDLVEKPTKEAKDVNQEKSIDDANISQNDQPNQIVTTDLKPSEGFEFESNGDGTCTIIGIGSCKDTDIVIPVESPEGDTVTLIDEYALYSLEDVESITIINYNYEIGKCAFQYGEFTSLSIIGGTPSIKESAFSSCEDLNLISISNCNVQSDDYAFYSCGKDANVIIDSCTGTIGKYAFEYGDITNITISNCELNIEESAFSSCEDAVSIALLNSTLEMSEYAFYSCGKDADITISKCNGTIGKYAFEYGDFASITIGDCELAIEESAFLSCENLTSIVFSDSTLEMGEYAFYSCGDSAIIEMTNCSLMFDDYAFQYSSLANLTIAGSEVIIGESVFSSCEDLVEITINCDSLILGKYAFYSCDDLANVTICQNSKSDNEIKIDDWAFQYCETLSTVNIGNGNIKIGESVFSGCDENLIINIAGNSYTANGVNDLLK